MVQIKNRIKNCIIALLAIGLVFTYLSFRFTVQFQQQEIADQKARIDCLFDYVKTQQNIHYGDSILSQR